MKIHHFSTWLKTARGNLGGKLFNCRRYFRKTKGQSRLKEEQNYHKINFKVGSFLQKCNQSVNIKTRQQFRTINCCLQLQSDYFSVT